MNKASTTLLVALAVATIGLSALYPVVGLAAVGILSVVLFCWRRPKRAFAVWMVSLAFLPVWVSTSGVVAVSVSSLVGALCVVCVGKGPTKPHKIDLLVLTVLVTATLATVFAGSPSGETVTVATMWIGNYVASRVLASHIGLPAASKIFAIIMTSVGALAVVEFLLGWHPYLNLQMSNLLYEIWSPIQVRGGVERSEWAFGHSIALGGALALAVPFAVTMRAPILLRVTAVTILFAGVAVTFSRSGLISVVLSTILVLFFSRSLSGRVRVGITAVAGAAALLIAPSVLAVFSTAGDEVTNSGGYRGDLLSTLPFMNWLGISPVVQLSPSGFRSYGRFVSIDSALISIGLDFGIALALLLAALLLIPVVRTLMRRGNTAEIALFGQLPLILTVAFITQWQGLLWLVAGLAVSASNAADRTGPEPQTPLSASLPRRQEIEMETS